MTMRERSGEATRLIVRTILRTARPDQVQRLLQDISNTGPRGEGSEAS